MRHTKSSDDSLHLFQLLVRGRWLLEKASYLFYSETLRDWLPSTEEAVALILEEKQKMILTGAVERFIETPRSS